MMKRYLTELDYLRALEKAVFQVVPRACGPECCQNPPLDEALVELADAYADTWDPEYGDIPPEPPVASTRPDLEAYFFRDERTWDDLPLPEDDAIKAAHPIRTGRHKEYEEALRLVHARRSKGGLVELVSWLLVRVNDAEKSALKGGGA